MVVISHMIYIFSPFYLIPSDGFFRIFSKPLKTAVYIKDLRTVTPFSSLSSFINCMHIMCFKPTGERLVLDYEQPMSQHCLLFTAESFVQINS